MTANRVVVSEHGSLSVGSSWNAQAKTIARQQALAIDAYQNREGIRIFDIGLRTIRATNWVGSIGIGEYSIDVVPKIDTVDSSKAGYGAMENLFHMVSTAGLIPMAPAQVSQLANSGKPLIAGFLDLYVTALAKEWTRGPIRQYVSVEASRPYLRGKLLFARHLTENTLHKERFFTASDEFISDNPVSRLLKSALRVCEAQRLNLGTSVKAKELMCLFDEVSDAELLPAEISRICVDRPIFRYEPIVNLAKLIVSQVSPSGSEVGYPVYSLMFDMNVVFERFIAEELRRAVCGTRCTVKAQISGRSLLRRDGTKAFHLRPDIGVFADDKVICLIDTKWKLLDSSQPHDKVSQSDMYQMYAYGKEYDVRTCVLLYPRSAGLAERVATYCHNEENGSKRKVEIRSVDVSSPLGNGEVRRKLREYLRDLALSG